MCQGLSLEKGNVGSACGWRKCFGNLFNYCYVFGSINTIILLFYSWPWMPPSVWLWHTLVWYMVLEVQGLGWYSFHLLPWSIFVLFMRKALAEECMVLAVLCEVQQSFESGFVILMNVCDVAGRTWSSSQRRQYWRRNSRESRCRVRRIRRGTGVATLCLLHRMILIGWYAV
jgi:hypothetical protein